jgi:L-fuconolactonase
MHPYLDVAFECFGAERLMIGSDWPVCTVAGDYQRTMAVVINYLSQRSSHERDAVLGGNAIRCWNLQVPVTHA